MWAAVKTCRLSSSTPLPEKAWPWLTTSSSTTALKGEAVVSETAAIDRASRASRGSRSRRMVFGRGGRDGFRANQRDKCANMRSVLETGCGGGEPAVLLMRFAGLGKSPDE